METKKVLKIVWKDICNVAKFVGNLLVAVFVYGGILIAIMSLILCMAKGLPSPEWYGAISSFLVVVCLLLELTEVISDKNYWSGIEMVLLSAIWSYWIAMISEWYVILAIPILVALYYVGNAYIKHVKKELEK